MSICPRRRNKNWSNITLTKVWTLNSDVTRSKKFSMDCQKKFWKSFLCHPVLSACPKRKRPNLKSCTWTVNSTGERGNNSFNKPSKVSHFLDFRVLLVLFRIARAWATFGWAASSTNAIPNGRTGSTNDASSTLHGLSSSCRFLKT